MEVRHGSRRSYSDLADRSLEYQRQRLARRQARPPEDFDLAAHIKKVFGVAEDPVDPVQIRFKEHFFAFALALGGHLLRVEFSTAHDFHYGTGMWVRRATPTTLTMVLKYHGSGLYGVAEFAYPHDCAIGHEDELIQQAMYSAGKGRSYLLDGAPPEPPSKPKKNGGPTSKQLADLRRSKALTLLCEGFPGTASFSILEAHEYLKGKEPELFSGMSVVRADIAQFVGAHYLVIAQGKSKSRAYFSYRVTATGRMKVGAEEPQVEGSSHN